MTPQEHRKKRDRNFCSKEKTKKKTHTHWKCFRETQPGRPKSAAVATQGAGERAGTRQSVVVIGLPDAQGAGGEQPLPAPPSTRLGDTSDS